MKYFKNCRTEKDVNVVLGTMTEIEKKELLDALQLVEIKVGLTVNAKKIERVLWDNIWAS